MQERNLLSARFGVKTPDGKSGHVIAIDRDRTGEAVAVVRFDVKPSKKYPIGIAHELHSPADLTPVRRASAC